MGAAAETVISATLITFLVLVTPNEEVFIYRHRRGAKSF